MVPFRRSTGVIGMFETTGMVKLADSGKAERQCKPMTSGGHAHQWAVDPPVADAAAPTGKR